MSEQEVVHDWRGTEIKIGSKVIYHGRGSYAVGIGTITQVVGAKRGSWYWGYVKVDWQEHKGHNNKKSQPLLLENVTVLTKDMFDAD